MKCPEVIAFKRRIDAVINYVDKADALKDDDERLAHWANYICILVSGFLEVAVREVYGNFADDNCGDPNLAYFVRKTLDRQTNINTDKALNVAKLFSVEWHTKLGGLLDPEQRTAINNIVTNRNLIVHGRNCDISYDRIKRDYACALQVAESIEQVCGI
ncbi:MAG: HEPN domain-containing protein [Armatimonadetes bacterium]|nr:HEPN domain-containing protein [Armatimonadota bacterium]